MPQANPNKNETLSEKHRSHRSDLDAKFEELYAKASAASYDNENQKQDRLDQIFNNYRKAADKLADMHAEQIRNAPPDANEIIGKIVKIIFHDPELGKAILNVKTARGATTTVVGYSTDIAPGQTIAAKGQLIYHEKHGRQFNAALIEILPPDSIDGITKFLASGLARGLGAAIAKKIATAFGRLTFYVAEHQPWRLCDVPGVDEDLAQRIAAALQEKKAEREAISFLLSLGVGFSQARRVFDIYGVKTIKTVKEDPYCLARDVPKIGFKTADRIARQFGVTRDAPERISAAIHFSLCESHNDGHCGLPKEDLIKSAIGHLNLRHDIVVKKLNDEISEKNILIETIENRTCAFEPSFYFAERRAALHLVELGSEPPRWKDINVDREIARVVRNGGKTPSPSQRDAIEKILRSKTMVLTGGPGSGKTTLLDTIIRILGRLNLHIEIAAPTGRAARRISEQTGREARTIHRLLRVDRAGAFMRHAGNPLECDVVIIDEASMIDAKIMAALMDAIPSNAALLLVGDVDQLPSVRPGCVLADMINSGTVPVTRLTETHRQSAGSRIIDAAKRIKAGQMPDLPAFGTASDFHVIHVEDQNQGARKILEIVSHLIKAPIPTQISIEDKSVSGPIAGTLISAKPQLHNNIEIFTASQNGHLDPIRDIQVLCPVKNGKMGSISLNADLQDLLNPHPEKSVNHAGRVFTVGDKVMQIKNDYERDVVNGDGGVVSDIDDSGMLLVDFSGRIVKYSRKDLHTLIHAYAVTVHKSQGSEYPVVIISFPKQYDKILTRNLLYTAVTRGKKHVIIVAQKQAIATAVETFEKVKRWTKLKEWLIKYRKTVRKEQNTYEGTEFSAGRQKIIARIKALKNKTVERGCTESEALAAANKVKALMANYAISEEDIA